MLYFIANILYSEHLECIYIFSFGCFRLTQDLMTIRALHFRSRDRALNAMSYPNLFYPQVYLLQGGYRDFHLKSAQHCEPHGGYIEMSDSKYQDLYKIESSKRPFRKCFSEGFLH